MYDFIIVGAGSAGCVVANRLSADPSHRVLLLEAGRDERRKETWIPAAWSKLFKSDCDWSYETEPNPGLDGRRLFVPRGKALGGTSVLNALMYVRGHRADYDEWAAAGNHGWSYDELLPYFKQSEDNDRGASAWHGAGGPLAVSGIRHPHPLTRAFVEAAVNAGLALNEDCNGPTQDGVAFIQITTRGRRRCSAADAFLRPIMHRPNLTVLTGARATAVVFDGRRAAGVSYTRAGQTDTVRAEREVILCGGAFNSPQLLMLSGVGPADELRRHAIPVVQDLPGVGRNLQEHPLGKLLVRCRQPYSLLAAESPVNLFKYFVLGRGMLVSNGAEAAAFARTRMDCPAPDLEIIMLPVLWHDEGLVPPTEHGFSMAAVVLKPHSRGVVTLRSARPDDAPVIHTNHFSDPDGVDLRTAVAGLRLARAIAAALPLGAECAGEVLPGADATSDEALAASVRREAQTVYHPVGTCRMGSDPLSVVDPELKVHGVEGLRVIDASIMPTIVRGHTHAAAVMIGEKGAAMVLGES